MVSLAIIGVAIACLVILVAWDKVHPFLAFVLVATGAAVAGLTAAGILARRDATCPWNLPVRRP
ncbi:MAG: hypothetical protein ACKOYJ_06180 [Planctomycetia bacterium]